MLTPEDNPASDIASERLRRVLGDDPFRLITDNVGDVVSLLDIATMRLLYISPSVERQCGFTSAEALEQDIEDVFTEDSCSALRAALAEQLTHVASGDAEAARHTLELQQRRKDGSLITVELRGNPVRDEDGEIRCVLAVTRDVTDRVADRDALRRQRDLVAALSAARDLPQALDEVIDAALSIPGVDAAGVYLAQEDTGDLELVRHAGLPPRFVAASSYFAADSPNARLVAAGAPFHLTAAQVSASGLAVERSAGLRAVSSVPVLHEGAVVAALNVASRSADELAPGARTAVESLAAQVGGALARLRAEARLQESERRHRSLFMDSPVALWESDCSLVKAYLDTLAASGIDDVMAHVLGDPAEYDRCVRLMRPVAVNTAAVRLYDAADETELMRRGADVHPPPSGSGVHLFWAQMLAGGGPVSYETQVSTLTGRTIDVLETVSVVPGYEDTYGRVSIAGIDVTARRQAEREAARQAELQRRLADMATTYIGVPLDAVEQAIDDSLADLGRFVGADHVSVVEYDRSTGTASATHTWRGDGIETPLGDQAGVSLSAFDEWAQSHRTGELLHVRDGEALPQGPARAILESAGLRSLLSVPMMDGDVPTGFVGFGTVHSMNDYPEGERRLLSLFAAMLAGVRHRMRTELARREGERRLQNVIQGTRAGTWEWNVQTGETVFNQRWAEILGYRLADLEPVNIQTWASLAHPDDLAASDAQLGQVFARRRDYYDIECRMQHRDGHWVWVHDRGTVTEWLEDGRPLWMSGTHVDVTEAHEAREALRAGEERLRDLALTTADWLWEVDAEGRYTSCSDKVRDVLGYEPHEVVGRTPFAFMAPGEAERLGHVFAGLIERREGCAELVNTNLHRDGHEVVLSTSCVPVLGDSGLLLGFRGVDKDVTAEVQAREALLQSEARYRAVSDTAADAVITAGLDGTITGWNPAAQLMFGYTEAEAVGSPVTMLMPDAFRHAHPAAMRRVRDGGSLRLNDRVMSLEGRRSDGSEFPIELSMAEWELAGVRSITTIVRDVSERHAAERALAASEAQFRLLAENASDLVFRADNDGVTLWVSPSVTAALGWRPEELVGLSIAGFVHPDDLATLRGAQSVLLEGEAARYELRLRTADGDHRWMAVSSRPIVDEHGVVVGRVGGLRDIQSEVEARRALAASEEQYRRVFDVEPDGLLLVDRQTLGIVDANESAVRMYGFDREELLRQSLGTLSAEPEATRRTIETAAGPSEVHVPLRSHRRRDGSVFPVEVSAAGLRLDDRDLVCLALRDVTDREAHSALAVASSEVTARLLRTNETATSSDLYNVILLPLLLATAADRVRVYEQDAATGPEVPYTQKAYLAAPGAYAVPDPGTWATRRDFGEQWSALVSRGEPFQVHADASGGIGAVPREAQVQSLLALPFGTRGDTTGFVALEFARHRREWGRDELLQLGAAASALSTALERQRALRAVRARTGELSALLDASRAIVSTIEYDRVLHEVARAAGEALDAPECVIWEYVERRRQAEFRCLWERDPRPGLAESLAGTSYGIDGYPGGLQQLRRGHASQQSRSDPDLTDADADAMDGHGEKTWLTVPLVAAEELVGVMTLIESEAERDFLPGERRLAEAIGEQAAVALSNARLYRRQEERNRWLHSLVEAGRQVTSRLAMDALLENVARLAAESVLAPVVFIYEYDAGRDALVTRSRYGPDGVGREEPCGAEFPLDETPGDRRALFGGEVFVETLSDPALLAGVREDMLRAGEKTLVNVPFRFAGEPLGMMVLIETEAERDFTGDELDYLSAFGEQAAVALHNARLYATIEKQAATDGATGLANQRAFYQRLELELARTARYSSPVSLLLVDIDDFKSVNDSYGHLAGDDVLRAIAGVIAEEVRTDVDLPARYGGEEFAVILPETVASPEPGTVSASTGGGAVAERIRARIAAEPFVLDSGVELRLTVSVGVASAPDMAKDAPGLMACADAALYAAKAAGKDCVRVGGG